MNIDLARRSHNSPDFMITTSKITLNVVWLDCEFFQ
jgi:hypothetical protein